MNIEILKNKIKNQQESNPLGNKKREPRPPEVRQKISASLKGKKKNYVSWLKGRTGENHPSYKHGHGKRRVQIHEEKFYAAWVQGVYQTWNFCCALTGTNVGPLEAHHLNAWNTFPDERFDLSNGVLLCASVHKQFHTIYGNGGNTRAQFDAFVEQHWKNVDCEWNKRKISDENHQPTLTFEQIVQNQKTYKEKSFDRFLDLVQEREHKLVSGKYENIHSEICIYCPKHKSYSTTTFFNYKRSKTGLRCCGYNRIVEKSASYVRDEKTGRFRDFTSINLPEQKQTE